MASLLSSARNDKLTRISPFGCAFLISSVLAAVLFCFSLSPARPAKKDAGPRRTNLLLITVDTLRPDRLGCYGNARVKTPSIDGLAQRGALFTRAFAHTPTTLPSHTNILLGTTPVYHGVHDNHNFVVREEFLTLAEHLKGSGYAAGAFVGAFPLDSRFGLTQGCDVYDDNYGTSGSQEFSYVERKAEVVVDKALEWLRKQHSPWFLWVHCIDPHHRYEPPEPFKTEYGDRPYDGEVAYVDHSLGRLLDYVRNQRLDEKTMVVFTGDHGESLGQHGESTHGYFAYNSTLWVPLIMACPRLKSGSIDQPVAHIDIFPTVCDVLGISRPPHLQGLSLLSVLGGKKLPKRALYFESLYPFYSRGWAPLRGFIRESDKFMESPIPELYDIAKDFDETRNLAESTRLDQHREVLSDLMAKEAYDGASASGQKADRQTMERLKSLGYLSSPQAPRKDAFTAQDDLKVLLPYQSRLQQAMGAYHKGDLERGASLLRDIIAERKDFDLAYTYLATLYKEQNKLKEAVGVLRSGFENCPGSYKIIITFGMFLTEVGAYDQAIDILKSGLAIIDYDPELWNYLGVAYWRKGDYEEGSKALQQALALDGNYPFAMNNLGSVYLSAYLRTKDAEALKKATANFRKAIELDPNYESAYNGLGTALQAAGDLDGAILNWKKAVGIKPDYGFALYNLGLAYLLKGEKASALEYLQRYRDGHYAALSPREQQKLDKLIARCK